MNMVIAGCSRRKLATAVAVPALDLYEGGCIAALRTRADATDMRARVRILSARHGLVRAEQPLLPYDQPLHLTRAVELRPLVAETLRCEWASDGWPEEILTVLGPLYMVCLADLLAMPGRPRIRWVADPTGGWAEASAVLDEWGWR